MAVTPRRSTRGALFTPSPHPSQVAAPANTSYEWLSAPTSVSTSRTTYSSFRRIVHHAAQSQAGPSRTPLKQRKKVAKGDEESRFTVGDGVMVGVDGGDGVGVVIGMWEAHTIERQDRDEDEDEEDNERGEEDEEEDGPAKGMMAEVHWCFRKQDLPSVMKNMNVEDVSLDTLSCFRLRLDERCRKCQ